jgi:hypothetical protein
VWQHPDHHPGRSAAWPDVGETAAVKLDMTVETPLFSEINPWIFRGFLAGFLITKTPAHAGVKN